MGRKRFSPEKIIVMLRVREGEVLPVIKKSTNYGKKLRDTFCQTFYIKGSCYE
jgi:hypothetical protein